MRGTKPQMTSLSVFERQNLIEEALEEAFETAGFEIERTVPEGASFLHRHPTQWDVWLHQPLDELARVIERRLF